MCEAAIQLTSEHFARCEFRSGEARIPMAVAVDPFNPEIECKNFVIPKCQKCGQYVTKIDENAYVQTKWKCEFCDFKNEELIPFNFSNSVDFEVQLDELPAQTFFIVDSTLQSRSTNFLSIVLNSLNRSILEDMTNFAVANATDTISYLVSPSKIYDFPFLSDLTELPPFIFHKTNERNFTKLSNDKSQEKFHINKILTHLTSGARKNSRIVLFIASQPYEFQQVTSSSYFNSPNINLQLQNIIQKCQKDNISISILCYMSEEIDISALSTITDFTGGEFILLEKNQLNEIENETNTLCNAIQMRCSLKTLPNIRIESSFGFRPRNPYKFSLYSTESVIFPLALVGLGKKSVPFQLIITYISHQGRKRMKVFTRHLDLTDSLVYIFNESYKDVILKYIASFLAEKTLQNEKDFEMKARNILWPIFFDYQTHGLFRDKPDKFKLIYPKNLENLVYEVVSLLHFSGFSESTQFYRKLYQLRRLSTAKLSFLKQIVNSKIIDFENGQEIEQNIDNFDKNRIYTLYDGFTTYIWGNSKITSLDQSKFKGAVSLVNPASDYIMRERMVYEDTPYSSSLSNFSEKLLDDVFTEGHKFVLHLTEEEMKRLEDAF